MDVGKRITYLRIQKGYSVNKLANLSGISQSYLRDVELGKKNPTVEVLSYVCDALNISLSDFFDEQLTEKFSNNSLMRKIYQLTPEQQSALLNLLNTILES